MTDTTSTRLGSGAAEGQLLAAAQAGDEGAFERLVATYRRQLHAHCYRMLGSLQDAEDALQETLLAAWRGLAAFEGRSSLRTWLYRIATNASLRLGERRPRRILSPEAGPAWTDVHDIGDFQENDPIWLEPYPTAEGGLASADPADRYQRRENVELAFIAALQKLPANQRAVLILRDVLQFSASEVAEALDTTVVSVNSALQRAHKTVDHRIVEGTQPQELAALGAEGRQDLVAAFVSAWDRADVDTLLDMLAEDVHFSMPPYPAWFYGKDDVRRFLSERAFMDPWRTRSLEVSGQPAIACYRQEPCGPEREGAGQGRFLLGAIQVLTLRDGKIAAMTAFLDPATQRWFDLPAEWVG